MEMPRYFSSLDFVVTDPEGREYNIQMRMRKGWIGFYTNIPEDVHPHLAANLIGAALDEASKECGILKGGGRMGQLYKLTARNTLISYADTFAFKIFSVSSEELNFGSYSVLFHIGKDRNYALSINPSRKRKIHSRIDFGIHPIDIFARYELSAVLIAFAYKLLNDAYGEN